MHFAFGRVRRRIALLRTGVWSQWGDMCRLSESRIAADYTDYTDKRGLRNGQRYI